MRILSGEDIKKVITMQEAIRIMETTFAMVNKKEVIMPDRVVMNINDRGDAMLFMPTYIPESKGLGVKIISFFPENTLKKIPAISGIIILNDPDTGQIVSIMDAPYITTLRTGATSAVATELLAIRDARTLGILGAGTQAKSQIEGILEVRDIKRVKIFDLDYGKSKKLCQRMRKIKNGNCNFCMVNTSDEAIIDSDIIITATTSEFPVFNGDLLNEGVHINAIGSFKPHIREIDDIAIMRSKVFVDSYALCLKEAGDIIIPLKEGIISRRKIQADLGELILKEKKGRESDKEITLFKSVGLAVQDVAIAQKVYYEAESCNLGQKFTRDLSSD